MIEMDSIVGFNEIGISCFSVGDGQSQLMHFSFFRFIRESEEMICTTSYGGKGHMDMWLVIAGLILGLLIILGKFVPVFSSWMKNEKSIAEDFCSIQKAIKAGIGQLEAINKFYLGGKSAKLDSLVEDGKLFSRMAYLENKMKWKEHRSDLLKTVISTCITLILSLVVAVLQMNKETIDEPILSELKMTLLWICGFFFLFFGAEQAVCYFTDTENKNDEIYRYELSVIKKVLEMRRDKAITVDYEVSVATNVSSSEGNMFNAEIGCTKDKVSVTVKSHESSERQVENGADEKETPSEEGR